MEIKECYTRIPSKTYGLGEEFTAYTKAK